MKSSSSSQPSPGCSDSCKIPSRSFRRLAGRFHLWIRQILVIWYWLPRYVLASGTRIAVGSTARTISAWGVEGDWARGGIG